MDPYFGRNYSSRRSFLKLGAAALAGASSVMRSLPALAADAEGDYGGLPIGVQSYTFRSMSLDNALAAMKQLGIKEVEFFPAHIAGLSPKQVLDKCKENGVTAVSYGVIPFNANTDENRKMFELAKTFGMKNLSCDPTEDAFDSLDKLTEEYGITVAIHPHGPGSRWVKIDQIWNAVKDHSPKIGLNNETGWLIAADEDPVRACDVFKDRMHAMHLKDFKKTPEGKLEDVPAGGGQLKVDDLVKKLLEMKWRGVLSVEYEGGDEVNSVQKSLDRIKEAVKKATVA